MSDNIDKIILEEMKILLKEYHPSSGTYWKGKKTRGFLDSLWDALPSSVKGYGEWSPYGAGRERGATPGGTVELSPDPSKKENVFVDPTPSGPVGTVKIAPVDKMYGVQDPGVYEGETAAAWDEGMLGVADALMLGAGLASGAGSAVSRLNPAIKVPYRHIPRRASEIVKRNIPLRTTGELTTSAGENIKLIGKPFSHEGRVFQRVRLPDGRDTMFYRSTGYGSGEASGMAAKQPGFSPGGSWNPVGGITEKGWFVKLPQHHRQAEGAWWSKRAMVPKQKGLYPAGKVAGEDTLYGRVSKALAKENEMSVPWRYNPETMDVLPGAVQVNQRMLRPGSWKIWQNRKGAIKPSWLEQSVRTGGNQKGAGGTVFPGMDANVFPRVDPSRRLKYPDWTKTLRHPKETLIRPRTPGRPWYHSRAGKEGLGGHVTRSAKFPEGIYPGHPMMRTPGPGGTGKYSPGFRVYGQQQRYGARPVTPAGEVGPITMPPPTQTLVRERKRRRWSKTKKKVE